MNRINYTELLYAKPSLWEGFARVLDIGGNFSDYNYSSSDDEADEVALASDWYAVGADLHRAINRYKARVDRANAAHE